MIFVNKMSDASLHTLFHNDSCKMVKGVMVLMKGVHIGTLYKLLGNANLTGCNNIVSPGIELTMTQRDSISTHLDLTQGNSVQIHSKRHDEIDLTRP
jgi:hypothetical protein